MGLVWTALFLNNFEFVFITFGKYVLINKINVNQSWELFNYIN